MPPITGTAAMPSSASRNSSVPPKGRGRRLQPETRPPHHHPAAERPRGQPAEHDRRSAEQQPDDGNGYQDESERHQHEQCDANDPGEERRPRSFIASAPHRARGSRLSLGLQPPHRGSCCLARPMGALVPDASGLSALSKTDRGDQDKVGVVINDHQTARRNGAWRHWMIDLLLAVLVISALLLVTHAAMSVGLALLKGDVPSWGPIRYARQAQIVRRQCADLDREYESLLRDYRLGGNAV